MLANKTARLLLAASALALAPMSLARAEGEAKCTIATKGDSPIAKACAEGGQKAAAKKMKELVKAAKAKGTKFTCDGCHEDMETFKLNADAGKGFAKLLEAAK